MRNILYAYLMASCGLVAMYGAGKAFESNDMSFTFLFVGLALVSLVQMHVILTDKE